MHTLASSHIPLSSPDSGTSGRVIRVRGPGQRGLGRGRGGSKAGLARWVGAETGPSDPELRARRWAGVTASEGQLGAAGTRNATQGASRLGRRWQVLGLAGGERRRAGWDCWRLWGRAWRPGRADTAGSGDAEMHGRASRCASTGLSPRSLESLPGLGRAGWVTWKPLSGLFPAALRSDQSLAVGGLPG